MKIQLKNDWKYVGDDRWKWELYLVSDEPNGLSEIDSVKYMLHPTFKNPIRVVNDPEGGFRLKTNGWGTFTINAFVYFKNGKKVKMKHELDLRYEPSSGTSK